MRTMLKIYLPTETGNKVYKDGTLAKTFEAFMQQHKPEAAYFFPEGGKRAALFVFDLSDPTHIVTVAERFFLDLEADVFMTPVMTADDLKAGIEKTK
jgi:hypothetical protein